MDFSEATVLITGGNSGIGRGLAEALDWRGARVVITGRDEASLRATLYVNYGMIGYQLDISRPDEVRRFAAMIVELHPNLNALFNNAGFMALEDLLAGSRDNDLAQRTIATNLLGPIQLTTALLPHLLTRSEAAIVNVTSGLAFIPRAATPTYGASKAALHSWTQALRHQLRRTNVTVAELVPPLVATSFAPGQADNPAAMPLAAFIDEVVELMCGGTLPDEILVEQVKLQRTAERTGQYDTVFKAINPD